MESLAIAYAYAAYEIEQGIEYEIPKLFDLKFLPNAGWLVWIGALIFSQQILFFSPAIAQTPTYDQPVYGAVVKTSGNCLNARRVPSKAGDIYDCLKQGTTLKAIVKEENGWYQLSSGGWVSKNYVALPSTSSPPKTSPQNGTKISETKPCSALKKLLNCNPQNWTYDPKTPLRGDNIKTLQKHLNYYQLLAKPIEVTGVYDLQTKLAVEMFQKKKRFAVDGVTGVETWQALKMGA